MRCTIEYMEHHQLSKQKCTPKEYSLSLSVRLYSDTIVLIPVADVLDRARCLQKCRHEALRQSVLRIPQACNHGGCLIVGILMEVSGYHVINKLGLAAYQDGNRTRDLQVKTDALTNQRQKPAGTGPTCRFRTAAEAPRGARFGALDIAGAIRPIVRRATAHG
jgi:hypothetical protein